MANALNATAKARAQAFASLLGIDLDKPINLEVANFSSLQEIQANISSPLTGYPSSLYPQMCFGVAIEEPTNGTVNVNMVFSAFNQDIRTQSIPSTINKVWDEFDIN